MKRGPIAFGLIASKYILKWYNLRKSKLETAWTVFIEYKVLVGKLIYKSYKIIITTDVVIHTYFVTFVNQLTYKSISIIT